ncbi:hypothetical protein C0Q70_07021 [Pomacea canaliculata]|uniref:Uncharacterized protein n=1 Tax=Pomacea canaliculata TaxID=400727 RepID=A0A2T7PDW4_POMCA|nr:hypothetical protein C0Q70_07021 [Pomacea canaliculata]
MFFDTCRRVQLEDAVQQRALRHPLCACSILEVLNTTTAKLRMHKCVRTGNKTQTALEFAKLSHVRICHLLGTADLRTCQVKTCSLTCAQVITQRQKCLLGRPWWHLVLETLDSSPHTRNTDRGVTMRINDDLPFPRQQDSRQNWKKIPLQTFSKADGMAVFFSSTETEVGP